MANNVLIGIQARSGSKRLPGKVLELIDDEMMIDHVIGAAKKACTFVNRGKNDIYCSYAVVIPENDPIRAHLAGSLVFEGSESDVLSRYDIAFRKTNPDWLVRITGDCPLILPNIISSAIVSAVRGKIDYVSNTYEDYRTYVDGFDVEVISSRLFKHLRLFAETPYDREHVTTLVKRHPPAWATQAVIVGHLDLSDLKLSVDTIDELNNVRRLVARLNGKIDLARERGMRVIYF